MRSSAQVFLLAGFALAAIGAADVALLLYPTRFGDIDWEFGVLSQVLDALPLMTIGLVLVVVGIKSRGGRHLWPRALAVWFIVMTLAVVAIIVTLALAFAPAIRVLHDPQAAPAVKKILAKSAFNGLCYVILYGVLARFVWKDTSQAVADAVAAQPPAP